MSYQVDLASGVAPGRPEAPPAPPQLEIPELLKQILEVQKEVLAHQRAASSSHDLTSRWRAFLNRWPGEFPGLPDLCKQAVPQLEKAYGRMIHELVERLADDEDTLDTDFALQDFLDRYGMKLAQIGTLLNLVTPLAEAGNNQDAQ
ncbi:MAG: hypothetical protein EXR99_14580 [Gemmataceae bacterium]|nr:hypothetical protein [Gemmataceae bacterium]